MAVSNQRHNIKLTSFPPHVSRYMLQMHQNIFALWARGSLPIRQVPNIQMYTRHPAQIYIDHLGPISVVLPKASKEPFCVTQQLDKRFEEQGFRGQQPCWGLAR
jgi:hypothetical protein